MKKEEKKMKAKKKEERREEKKSGISLLIKTLISFYAAGNHPLSRELSESIHLNVRRCLREFDKAK